MQKKLSKVQKKLLTAFYRERKKKSLAEIKVTELCDLAEVAHSSFYKYFVDIYDFNRWQEDRAYYNEVLSKADLDDMKSIFHYLLNFLWENFSRYHFEEIGIFFENIHTYNLTSIDFFPEKRQEIIHVLPLYITVQMQMVTYISILQRMGKRSISQRDYKIMEELWLEGIEKLKKYTDIEDKDRSKKKDETTIPLLTLVAGMKKH